MWLTFSSLCVEIPLFTLKVTFHQENIPPSLSHLSSLQSATPPPPQQCSAPFPVHTTGQVGQLLGPVMQRHISNILIVLKAPAK